MNDRACGRRLPRASACSLRCRPRSRGRGTPVPYPACRAILFSYALDRTRMSLANPSARIRRNGQGRCQDHPPSAKPCSGQNHSPRWYRPGGMRIVKEKTLFLRVSCGWRLARPERSARFACTGIPRFPHCRLRSECVPRIRCKRPPRLSPTVSSSPLRCGAISQDWRPVQSKNCKR